MARRGYCEPGRYRFEGDTCLACGLVLPPPLTLEEAERAIEEIDPALCEPLSEERIAEIVRYATRPHTGGRPR